MQQCREGHTGEPDAPFHILYSPASGELDVDSIYARQNVRAETPEGASFIDFLAIMQQTEKQGVQNGLRITDNTAGSR